MCLVNNPSNELVAILRDAFIITEYKSNFSLTVCFLLLPLSPD